ncbi:MAG: hypothetical protein P1P86_04465 [Bacteroidales bacterium]|nr:hypothetical protein [Bacteroidales bacterium]
MAIILGALWNPLLSQPLSLDFIYGGVEDAEIILQEYLKPYANILGSDLNAGWYNTARPHKLGGLDVTATVSWAKAPASALSYDLGVLDLNGTVDPNPGTMAPTIAGEQEERPRISYSEVLDLGGGNIEEIEYSSFRVPDGAGVDFIPLPMAQLTVGLPFGTDVSARFVPNIGYKDYGEIGLWGVGGKHSISQWLPFINKLKFLDISVQGGYTKVTSSVHVVVEPQSIVEVDNYPDFDWDDQFLTQKVEGWTVNLIASQTLPIISFYQGIGYASSSVDLLMEGHYPIHSVILDESSPDFGRVTYEILENPIETHYKNFNNLRMNVGARIKLGVLTLHYDFTYTLYATQSVGVGISFR